MTWVYINPMTIPEILCLVCQHLDRPSLLASIRVSHTWSSICTPLLWATHTFSAEHYSAHQDSYDQHATHIRFITCKRWTMGASLRFLTQHCTNLQSITLKDCHTFPSTFETLAEGLLNIRALRLEFCRGVKSLMASHLIRFPRLALLDIVVHTQERGEGDWREQDMVLLLTQCRALVHLRIVGTDLSHLHLLGVERMEKAEVLHLKSLELVSTFLSDRALRHLLGKCPDLKELTLLHNANKSSIAQVVALNCPDLIALNLRGSKSVSMAAFGAIFKACPRLIELDLGNTLVLDSGLSVLAENCPKLRRLDLKGCSRLTKVGFKVLVTMFVELRELCVRECTRLKVESFSGKEDWRCLFLEVLDMTRVGIKEGDSLVGLVEQLMSLTGLRKVLVDAKVGSNPHLAVMESRKVSLVVEEEVVQV